MSISNESSDEVALAELGRRLAQYRLNADLTQQAVAREAGVSLRTVQRLELGESTQLGNLVRVLRALKLLGHLDALVPKPAISPIQQLRLQGKTRKRASGKVAESSTSMSSNEPWSWGDSESDDMKGDDRVKGSED